jgi:hypothetical protein
MSACAAKAAVAHHQHVGVEQREPLLHRLDGVGQVLPRGLGRAVGLGQPGVRLVQQVQRPLQIAGALAHLILQHRRALELGIGRAGSSVPCSTRRISASTMVSSFLALPFGAGRRG